MGKKSKITDVRCYYNGKVASMDYVADPKQRFSLACHRVRDNAGTGYVVEDDKLYFLSPASCLAKLVSAGVERNRVLAEIAALKAE